MTRYKKSKKGIQLFTFKCRDTGDEESYMAIETDFPTFNCTKEVKHLIPRTIEFYYLDYQVSKEQALMVKLDIDLISIGIHWLTKLEWNSKHRIPLPNYRTNVFKPMGLLYQAIYKLCISCHAMARPLGAELPYLDAIEWFQCVIQEWIKGHTLLTILDLDTKAQRPDKPVINGKRQLIKQRSHIPDELRKYKNPFSKNSHIGMLIHLAITISKKSDIFDKKTYRPFVKAWRSYLRMMDSPEFSEVILTDRGYGRGLYIKKNKNQSLTRIL